ncbi:periplasmic chaperone for outer membrane proteins SurA [Chitinophaga costaii]|uniref:Periplasmic chaperone for outer membrane proteins SurA n=2 Tax=Chitinophaga costaii TaxID=1335309 RepID=A0A1C4ALD2_9BACT|nr:peptidylprolyl isomerase [Chitinophaga costaii]PUZ26657.1 peptidylprolyl isomerase [Chitinophaga costaii]SCB95492.1 periplasmic chaperone for outer membrane proteins SurA [Chitinophaga costaii]
MKKLLTLSVTALICWQAGKAQQKLVADKIVAIVGDKIVLKSEIDGELMNQERDQQKPLPAEAGCNIMEQIVAQKILVLQAERDSLPVSDNDVDGEIDNRIRYFQNLYGSQEKMKQVTGYSVYQLRERFREPIRDGLLAKAMREKIVNAVKVTPSEVKNFFDGIPKDSLPFFESELEIGSLVVFPKASYEMEKYATDKLLDYKKRIETKQATFSTLATLYSEDPSVKENEGVMVLNRNDKNMWDADFLSQAFRLKEGEISQPFKSQFGYHIVQCISRQGDNVRVQHILVKPVITNSDLTDATKKLDSIRANIISGKYNFAEAVAEYSDAQMAKFDGGMRQNKNNGTSLITIDQLDDPSDRSIVLMLDSLKAGDISQPERYTDEQGRQGVRIIYLKTRTKPHRMNLDDDYARIMQQALERKKAVALNKWLREKVPTYYVHVEDEYRQCPNISQWLSQETATVTTSTTAKK